MKHMIWLLMIAFSLSGPAFAEPRYELNKTDEGIVRLDKQTGAVSFCKQVGSGIACSMAAEERSALLEDNATLSTRIDALEKRLEKLEALKGTTKTKPLAELDPEEERQLDKAMRVAESMMKRFMQMAKELKDEFQTN